MSQSPFESPDKDPDKDSDEASTNQAVDSTSAPDKLSAGSTQGSLGVPNIFKILLLAVLTSTLIVSLLLNTTFMVVDEEETRFVNFQWILMVAALVVIALSIAMNFWLYYVRAMYLKDGPALVPEKWGRQILGLTAATEKSSLATVQTLKSVVDAANFQTKKSEDLLESFLTMQSAISSRDEEIKRLKKGYDAKIFKRFIKGFIRVSASLEEIKEEEKDSDQYRNYKFLCRKMQNALEDCGVETVFPEIGTDYRTLGDEVEDDPEVINTEDSDLDYQVESVLSPAYVLSGESDSDVVIPARVRIYRFELGEVRES